MSAWPYVPIGAAARQVVRPVAPTPGTILRQLGVRLWGEGAYERESIDGAATKYATLYTARANDIVVNKIWARNGSVAVVPAALDGAVGSGEFPMFTADRTRLDPRWMHWLTKTKDFWARCDEKSRGTSGKNRIRPEQFLAIEIPLPPLPVQQRLVARVDTISGEVASARGIAAEVSAESDALLEAHLARVFDKAIAGDRAALSKQVVLERGKFSHRPRNDPRFFGGAHPWIQIGEIESSVRAITSWTETLNDSGLAISKKFPAGTVLVSIAATIGAVGILAFDCCVPDSIVAATPRPGVSPDFLYYYFRFVRAHLESVAPQSAQKNVNLQILGSLPFPLISLAEQHRIVAELDALQAEIDALKATQATSRAELDALLPAVLDRAFSGAL